MGIRTTLGIVMLVTLISVIGPAVAEEGLLVKEVVFTGNTTRQESSLRELVKTKTGELFSDAKLQEDVSNLRAFFDLVTAQTEPVAGGLRVTFTVVEENPVLTSVVFRGFSGLSLETAQAEVWTKQGWPYAEFKVERDVARLEDLLRAKGYYYAEVKAAVGDYAGGKQVLFSAIEGPKVEIDEIRFVGNQAFDDDKLRDQMFSRESGFLTDAPYVRRAVDQDLVAVANYLRREGYLDAVVELREVTFSADKEDAYLTIGVSEGQPYVLSSVRIEGGASFPTDRFELESRILVKEGQIRRQEDLYLTEKALRDFYLENAYYDARIDLDLVDDSQTHTSALTIRITEGDTAKIRRVDISGNVFTREDVVRRYLTIHPGGPLNSLEVEKSKSRLEATSYFEPGPGGVQARVLDTDSPGVKDVVFRLSEGRTGSIRFSAGLTSDLGVMGLVEVEKRNFDIGDTPSSFGDVLAGRAFTGGGQRLDLSLSPGTDLSRYRLAFTEPWFLDTYLLYGPSDDVEESPFSLGLDVYLTDFTSFAYDEKRTGFSVSTGKSWRSPGRVFDDVFRSRLAFRLENVGIDNLEDDAPPNAFPLKGVNRVHRLTLGFGWDHVDLPASPGKGFEFDLSWEVAGGPLSGEIDYNKVEAGVKSYFTLYTTRDSQRHILTLEGRTGWANAYGDSDDVPLFDRFRLGGSSTVRGFAYGEVGPRAKGNPFTEEGRQMIEDSIARGDGDPIGGESMWLLRAEYSFPLYEDILRGVVFSDSGNVSVGHYDDDLWRKWRSSLGFGLRIRIPFLGPTPIALDFGWPLRKEKGDRTQVISFSIDRPF